MISVYIVDDEAWITIGLKKLIQKSGLPFEVIGEAHNGVTTLEDIKTLKPDVLFTDIRMPGLSGLEVMSYLSEHQKIYAFSQIYIRAGDFHSGSSCKRRSNESETTWPEYGSGRLAAGTVSAL